MCYACPVLIEMLEKLIEDDPKLLTTLETDATKFCVALPIPPTYKAYCQKFVDAALPDLLNALENDLPPSQVCHAAFNCSTTEGSGVVKAMKLTKAKAANSISLTKLRPSAPAAVGGVACDGCEALLKMIDDQLTNPSFQTAIIADIVKVCSSLPTQYQTQCTALVNNYGAALLKEAANELNPTTACATLNLCAAQTRFNVFMSLVGSQTPTNVLCSPCKYAAQEAVSYLKQYLPQLMQQLNGVCVVLPADLQSDCKSFIAQYGDKIGNDIINNPNLPTEACTYAGLCSSSIPLKFKKCIGNQNCNKAYNTVAIRNNQIAKVMFHGPQNREAVLCEMCGVFFGYLATELNNTKVQTDITDAVDIACAVFPDNMQPGCEQLVNQYVPMALTDAADALNPNVLCKQLKACP